ncbi:MAG: type II toxin-antitoxin system Phd/YefM family antitoxin [Hyphomicrobiales bacterium]|nr:MAG: type II toxin-antitoxin system Phd/YefM family antitoxin [Hyphomicrobiales bacterium]
MREVGVLEAKTSFTSLIAEVERTGEAVTVTRHGKAAVRIVPIRTPSPRSGAERAEEIRQLLARRDSRPLLSEWEDLSWDVLKRIARDEDRHD